jgi:hypothetical protein
MEKFHQMRHQFDYKKMTDFLKNMMLSLLLYFMEVYSLIPLNSQIKKQFYFKRSTLTILS